MNHQTKLGNLNQHNCMLILRTVKKDWPVQSNNFHRKQIAICRTMAVRRFEIQTAAARRRIGCHITGVAGVIIKLFEGSPVAGVTPTPVPGRTAGRNTLFWKEELKRNEEFRTNQMEIKRSLNDKPIKLSDHFLHNKNVII